MIEIVSARHGASRTWSDWIQPHSVAAVIICFAALLLGGGTRPDLPSDFILRLIAWPILVVVASLYLVRAELRQGRWYALAALALVLIPLLQLMPLPPWLWSALPGRQLLATGLRDAGLPLGWRSLTMDPSATMSSFLSLGAPLCAFLLVIQLTLFERRILSFVIIGFGLLSVVVGFLQISQGESSPLRFYAITNPSQAVGFFANRNHFAALLYMSLPIIAAWMLATVSKISSPERGELDGSAVVLIAFLISTFAIVLLAQGMASSRAGIGLAGVATLASFALMIPLRHQRSRLHSARYLVAAIGVGGILIANFALVRIFQRADLDQIDQYRVQFTQETLRAARNYFPIGSGMGTFVPVYFSIEQIANATGEYVNRAHNDFAETWLEAGVAAPLIVAAFVGWWLVRLVQIWRKQLVRNHVLDGLLVRAASIGVILPVFHSAFDYPLRTTAIATLFATFAGLLIDPVGRTDQVAEEQRSRTRRKRRQTSSSRPLPRPLGPELSPSEGTATALPGVLKIKKRD